MPVSALLAFYDARSVTVAFSQGLHRAEGQKVALLIILKKKNHVSNVVKVTGQHVLSGVSNLSHCLKNKKKKWMSQGLTVWIVRTVA